MFKGAEVVGVVELVEVIRVVRLGWFEFDVGARTPEKLSLDITHLLNSLTAVRNYNWSQNFGIDHLWF